MEDVLVSRIAFVTEEDMRERYASYFLPVLGFRAVGVKRADRGRRLWILTRPGIHGGIVPAPPTRPKPLILVFDVNNVLGARWLDKEQRWRKGTHCHGRHRMFAFYVRPGARRLIKLCLAAGHRVVLWSSMQAASVRALADVVVPPAARDRVTVLCNEDAPRDDEYPEMREGRNVAVVKDLRVVWSKLGAAAGARTLLFDDDPRKGRLFPESFVETPAFRPASPFSDECVRDQGCFWMLTIIMRAVAAA